MNLKKFTENIKLSPALGNCFINWMKLIIKNGWVSFKKIGRASLITALTLIGIPFRIFEKLRFHKLLDKIQIKKPPIFIIGHWRSGTTYLHNLFVQDLNLVL